MSSSGCLHHDVGCVPQGFVDKSLEECMGSFCSVTSRGKVLRDHSPNLLLLVLAALVHILEQCCSTNMLLGWYVAVIPD